MSATRGFWEKLGTNWRRRTKVAANIKHGKVPHPSEHTKNCPFKTPDPSKCPYCLNKSGFIFSSFEKRFLRSVLFVDRWSLGDCIKWYRHPISRHNKNSLPWNTLKEEIRIQKPIPLIGQWLPQDKLLWKAEYSRRSCLDRYILFTLMVLSVLFLLTNVMSAFLDKCCLVYMAAWFIILQQCVEMTASNARMVLVDVHLEGEKPTSPNRIILILLAGYFKLILCFGIAYQLWAIKVPNAFKFDTMMLDDIASKWFFFSFFTQMTVDYTDITASSFGAYLLAATQTSLGWLLITFLVARMLSVKTGAWK